MTLPKEAIIDRLIHKIREAPVDPEPADNIYLEEPFDPEVYREILKHLPSREAYAYDPAIHPDANLPDGTVTRGVIVLSDPEGTQRMNADDRQFWAQMTEVFVADALQQAIVDKFQTTIRAQWGEHLPEVVSSPILSRDSAGYFLRVHPDSPSRLATLQLYFPADESQIHLGTSFHRREADGFRLIKTNAFKPNSAYAFVRTDTSWHSVGKLGPEEADRNTLALTIFVKGKEFKPEKRYV